MRLYFATHAEAEGLGADRGLSERGRAQAARLDEEFARDGVVFDLVVVAPTRACRETLGQMPRVAAKVVVSGSRGAGDHGDEVVWMLGLKRLVAQECALLAGGRAVTVLVVCDGACAALATGRKGLGDACWALIEPSARGAAVVQEEEVLE